MTGKKDILNEVFGVAEGAAEIAAQVAGKEPVADKPKPQKMLILKAGHQEYALPLSSTQEVVSALEGVVPVKCVKGIYYPEGPGKYGSNEMTIVISKVGFLDQEPPIEED